MDTDTQNSRYGNIFFREGEDKQARHEQRFVSVVVVVVVIVFGGCGKELMFVRVYVFGRGGRGQTRHKHIIKKQSTGRMEGVVDKNTWKYLLFWAGRGQASTTQRQIPFCFFGGEQRFYIRAH